MDEEITKEQDILELADKLSTAITESEEYRTYRKSLERLMGNKELYERVNNLRRRNFELQNGESARLSSEEYSSLSEEASSLRQNPEADCFLDAESELGYLVQQVIKRVTEKIEFDNDFLN